MKCLGGARSGGGRLSHGNFTPGHGGSVDGEGSPVRRALICAWFKNTTARSRYNISPAYPDFVDYDELDMVI